MADASQNSDRNGETKSKVLVCDDSKIVRMTARKILAERFDLILAENGEEGWTLINSDPEIQVVFTDLGMPKLDGYGLIQRARTSSDQRVQDLPIIVITGAEEDDEEIKARLFELGATDFITKPFDSTSILARAEAHTSYQRTTRVLREHNDVDTLTGGLNRAGFNQRLDKDLSLVKRHRENLVFMVFELDDYPQIYERIGKKVSDNIIQTLAKLLNTAVRKEDSVARDGLFRFLISLPTAKAVGVINLAKRICSKVNTFKLKVGGETLTLSASVGIASTEAESTNDADSLVAHAEQALLEAQAAGRGEVRYFTLEPKASEEKASVPVEVSLDELLAQIKSGDTTFSELTLKAAADTLAPLLALMSAEQKREWFQ